MKLDVKCVFTEEITRLPISVEIDLSQVEFYGVTPFTRPVLVEGAVEGHAGLVILKADAHYRFEGRCDRCLGSFQRDGVVHMEHVLVVSAEDEENDDFVVVPDYWLDLSDLVQADLWLELPSKSLCKEDCKGLCATCGKDLNEGDCGCKKPQGDPRLSVLQQFLE